MRFDLTSKNLLGTALLSVLCALFASCSNSAAPTTTTPTTPHDTNTVTTHNVWGIVVNAANGASLPEAALRVSATGTDTVVVANETGVFQFSTKSSGQIHLNVVETGYATLDTTMSISSKAQDSIRIRLSAANSNLPTDGLVADIRFGDSVWDAKGNDFHYYGRPQKMEGHFYGDSTAGYIYQDAYGKLKLPMPFSHNFTATTWFNDFGANVGPFLPLILENKYHSYGLLLNIANRRAHGQISTMDADASIGGPIVRDGYWHFIAATMREISDTVTELRLFVDGKFYLDSTMDVPVAEGDMPKIDNTFYIGGEGDPSSGQVNFPLAGMLDGVRLYNRTLSESELLQIYHDRGY